MNKPLCDYRKKQPVKPRLKAPTASRRRGSIANKRLVELHPLATGGDMVTTPLGRGVSDMPRAFSLKRCRLSGSPATGLVGMQENAFLTDYFACLGFLPLASPCMIRQAMVKIMLTSMPQQRQETVRVGEISPKGVGHARFQQHGEDVGWGQTLAGQDTSSYPAECILWCTIALGALVQGCPSTFVAGYLKKARDALAECFDGTTVETARAYLVMAFLHSFLGDQENNQKYLAFANSIVERLPQGAIPSGMEHMLLAEGDESRLFHYGCHGSGIGVKLKEKSVYSNQIPSAKEIVHEKDICTFFFLADRYWHKAFLEDVENGSNATSGGAGAHNGGPKAEPGQFNEHGKCPRLKGPGGLDGGDQVAPPRSRVVSTPPPAGSAMRTCIKVILPELTSLLAMMERSDTFSGVGGFVLNGGMAYMQAVKGDMRGSFRSLKACAKVLMRFPGICRYRPHLVHCVMAAAASSACRKVYDPVKDIYNSILPWDGTPAPPMEEWAGMSCICNHVFCRSLGAGPTKPTAEMALTSTKFISARERAAVAPVHIGRSSGLHTASSTEETRRSLDCRAFRATAAAAVVGVAGTDGTTPCFTNGATRSSPTLAQTLSKFI